MSLDFYGIMITLFTTGDSASRRVDRVVWPKLLRPVLDCGHRSRAPGRDDPTNYIRYSMVIDTPVVAR